MTTGEADIFIGIRSKSNSQLENQKTAMAMLTAVEETIKQRDIQLVPAAYYGSLMSVLQKQLDEPDKYRKELIAIVQLMSLLFPELSHQLLRSQFSEISNALLEVSQAFADESSAALDRYLLQCYAHLVIAQEGSAWSSSDINSLFQQILLYIMDERPKVRKCATTFASHVLSHPPTPMVNHPGSSLTMRVVQHAARNHEDNKNALIHLLVFLKDSWRYLTKSHAESLAEFLLRHFSGRMEVLGQHAFSNMMAAMESYVKLATATSSWSFVKCQIFIQLIIQYKPNINDTVSLACWLSTVKYACMGLSSVCNDQLDAYSALISKIYSMIFGYLQLTPVKSAHTKIAHEAIEETLQALIDTISIHMVRQSLSASDVSPEEGKRREATCLESIIAQTEKGLTLAFQTGWSSVFHVIAHLVAKIGSFAQEQPECFTLMNSLLKKLAQDNKYAENPYFSLQDEFQEVIASTIRSMGPQKFLEYFPLNLDGDSKSRSWVLPLLIDNIRFGNLKYFIDYFVPLSIKIAQRGHDLISNGKEKEGKMCAVVWRQIWDILPSFCYCCLDLQEAFEPLMDLLVPMFSSADDRINSVCDTFRMLVTRNESIMKDDKCFQISSEKAKENLQYLSKYATKMLPMLFTKYVSLFSLEEQKSAKFSPQQLQTMVMETIRAWIEISTSQAVNQFFQTSIKSYLELVKSSAGKTMSDSQLKDINSQKHALFDVANSMIPSHKLSAEAINVFFKVITLELTSEDATIQKKSFKALANIFKSCKPIGDTLEVFGENPEDTQKRTENVRKSLIENPEFVDSLCMKMIETAMITELAAKKARLTVLHELTSLVDWKRKCQMQLIPAIISEVILATKESNEKTRNSAYDLLILMARKFIDIERQSMGEAQIEIGDANDQMDEDGESFSFKVNLEEFFKMIFAGFAGKTPLMISATIHACSRLLFEFNGQTGDISRELIEQIIQSVIIYSEETRNREIIRASIVFHKVFVLSWPDLLRNETPMITEDSAMDADQFAYLERTIQALLKWSGEHKSHFRIPCRYVIERIIRKVGLEQVENYFPEEQKKLLANIRKKRQRALKKKEQLKSLDSSYKSFEEFMDDIEEEAEDNADDNEMSEDDNDDLPQIMKEMVFSGSKSSRKSAATLVENEQGEPIDFLDTSLKVAGKSKNAATKTKRKADFAEEEGKLIITDSEEENDEEEELMSGIQRRIADINNPDSFKKTADGKKVKFSNKRSRDDDMDQDALISSALGVSTGNTMKEGRFLSKKQRIAGKEMKKAGIVHTGEEYRSKKAKGDIKRKGKPDPFAYIPLNPKIVASQKGRKKEVKLNKKLFFT